MVDETGQVNVNAYQDGGAGYYVVLHGASPARTPSTCTCRRPSWAPGGGTVAGQQIGKVGATGDATGLPPALRALDRAGVVRRRCRLRPAARAPLLGLILLGVPSWEKVRVAERGEIRAITTIFSVAFQGDPTWSWAFPDPSQRPEQYGSGGADWSRER